MRLNRPGELDVVITERTAAKIGPDLKLTIVADTVLDVGEPLDFFPVEHLPRIRDFIRDRVMPAFVGFVE